MAVKRIVIVLAVAGLALGGCKPNVAGGSTDGAEVYKAACAQCHGPTGKPPKQMADSLGVRDLTGADWMARRSKELVDHQVRKGSTNGRMPAFTGALKEEQIQAVVQYVMELPPAP